MLRRNQIMFKDVQGNQTKTDLNSINMQLHTVPKQLQPERHSGRAERGSRLRGLTGSCEEVILSNGCTEFRRKT